MDTCVALATAGHVEQALVSLSQISVTASCTGGLSGSQLEECTALFHSSPRQLWRVLRGSPSQLHWPLQTYEVWLHFMHNFIGDDSVIHTEPQWIYRLRLTPTQRVGTPIRERKQSGFQGLGLGTPNKGFVRREIRMYRPIVQKRPSPAGFGVPTGNR
jgi:hypothetical protein